MIRCTFDALPIADENALKSWLTKGAFDILLKLVEAKVKQHQVKALTEGLEASPDNDKGPASQISMREAQKYQHAIDVLQEIASAENHQIIKLS